MTMKLTATMMLSVDGVHQAREAPGEPARFERWGWVAAYNDAEGAPRSVRRDQR